MIAGVPSLRSRWRARWAGTTDPVLRSVRLLVLVLWPTVWVWTLPGQHRPGAGAVLAWVLVVLYSAGAVLLLGSGTRVRRVLPVCLPLFTLAGVAGAGTGERREMALLVPLFLGVLCVVAAMQLGRRATWVQVGVASLAALACVAWASTDLVTVVVASVAVVAGIVAPAAAVLRLRGQLADAHARERTLARTDPLTGLLNRRGLFERAAVLLAGARSVDVITLDLDGFKVLNDTHGHSVGDEALRAVAAALAGLGEAGGSLAGALVARLGGEEFLVLLAAGPRPLEEVAEAVRGAAVVRSGAGWRTSASVGAVRATLAPATHGAGPRTVRAGPAAWSAEDSQGWLLRRVDEADELMYRAKRSGGDRVLAGVA